MKQEIIEEMARIIAFDLCPNRSVHAKWGEEAQCYSDNNFAECTKIKNVVDKLYNAGYRKIPENAVVLTREEYEKLKLFEERVRSGVCFTQKEWFDYCQKDSNERTSLLIKAKKDTRKETAEKFKALLEGTVPQGLLDKICKEITDKEVQNGN